MRKHMLLLPLILLIGSSLHAQIATQVFRAGAGPVYFERGGLTGFLFYNEYSRPILPFLRIAPSLSFAYAGRAPYAEDYFEASALSLDLTGYMPFELSRQSEVQIGAGLSRRYISEHYLEKIEYILLPDGEEMRVDHHARRHEWGLGYTVAVNYAARVSDRWMAGAKASFQKYATGDEVWFLGFHGGFRF
ncbi:hypothetical protein SAMN05421823_10320 [Catalinimonas alkaloidigena]|uniref:Outer membrane protein beta-barrel domain-containing protein n=1 Tax=Catalinimonas alkaloidigena TaxID=1075417 RepID=A0A1G9D706_9BACT|nr:hypothetical protein [Catalinimonas alkaloidigena]SDK59485.1 hypothetical protein SAMN05421823_10320 [Catalinimonas alkaloidigena]